MTIFGWITVILWVLMAIQSPQNSARVFSILMLLGTLFWGTGSING